MNKPSSKEVGPAYADAWIRRVWQARECFRGPEPACRGKVQFYLAVYHDGYSKSYCEKHAVERRKYIYNNKRRAKKRLAAMRVGRVPKRTEQHPEWADDGRWTQ